jgi:hypothetical protein
MLASIERENQNPVRVDANGEVTESHNANAADKAGGIQSQE